MLQWTRSDKFNERCWRMSMWCLLSTDRALALVKIKSRCAGPTIRLVQNFASLSELCMIRGLITHSVCCALCKKQVTWIGNPFFDWYKIKFVEKIWHKHLNGTKNDHMIYDYTNWNITCYLKMSITDAIKAKRSVHVTCFQKQQFLAWRINSSTCTHVR